MAKEELTQIVNNMIHKKINLSFEHLVQIIKESYCNGVWDAFSHGSSDEEVGKVLTREYLDEIGAIYVMETMGDWKEKFSPEDIVTSTVN
jgi:hypothetical protein